MNIDLTDEQTSTLIREAVPDRAERSLPLSPRIAELKEILGMLQYVRHPLYLGEEVAVFGLFMQFFSIWTTIIFALQIAFQLRRIHNEEAVLTEILPEYAAYKNKTARLIPGIY